jgi:hypothetical protein
MAEYKARISEIFFTNIRAVKKVYKDMLRLIRVNGFVYELQLNTRRMVEQNEGHMNGWRTMTLSWPLCSITMTS